MGASCVLPSVASITGRSVSLVLRISAVNMGMKINSHFWYVSQKTFEWEPRKTQRKPFQIIILFFTDLLVKLGLDITLSFWAIKYGSFCFCNIA